MCHGDWGLLLFVVHLYLLFLFPNLSVLLKIRVFYYYQNGVLLWHLFQEYTNFNVFLLIRYSINIEINSKYILFMIWSFFSFFVLRRLSSQQVTHVPFLLYNVLSHFYLHICFCMNSGAYPTRRPTRN